jgi:hypothetical protein
MEATEKTDAAVHRSKRRSMSFVGSSARQRCDPA